MYIHFTHTMLPIHLVFVAAAATVLSSGVSSEGVIPSDFLVKWSFVADPSGRQAYYHMPRTVRAARNDSFARVAARKTDNTTVWCRAGDHRVCVLFDAKESVAGIVWSVAVKDVKASNTPIKIDNQPEWSRQTILGVDVYSLTAFFVSKDVLLRGGRTLSPGYPTVPDGLYFLQSRNGTETGRLHAPRNEKDAQAAGFVKQNCFRGQGVHYYQGLSRNTRCDDLRPYFPLYSPRTSQLVGFGFSMYGKSTNGSRDWYEQQTKAGVQLVVPNAPSCLSDYVTQYGLFTTHVLFLRKHWELKC